LFAGLFALFCLLSLQPIVSYDYFWHLATGRWIVDHNALPLHDPFAIASDGVVWLNGSWLYQAATYITYTLHGHAAVAVLRSIVVGATFAFVAVLLARRMSASFATFITILCFAGAAHRLGLRPETFAIACCVIAVAVLRLEPSLRNRLVYLLVSSVWMNLHPSALLAPILSLVDAMGDVVKRRTLDRELRGRLVRTALSAAVLLVNPHGIAGVTAPLHLASQVTAGTFVNSEWLPSNPMQFPGLFVAIVAGILLIITAKERQIGRELTFVLFALLAARYVRNHGFFFAVLPLLLESHIGELLDRRDIGARLRHLASISAGVVAALFVITHPPGVHVDDNRFPVAAVTQLQQLGLRGRIYNPDQFGGFLIWSFYPERVTLTDGRNELFRRFLTEYERARVDSRAWNAMTRKYNLTLAVEEYRARPLEVSDPRTGQTRAAAPSLAFFPRHQWALVAFDDVAMVFARRDAFAAEVLSRVEFRQLRPDLITRSEVTNPVEFAGDVQRAAASGAGDKRLSALLERLGL
jgi:hypothetical protein